MLACFAIQPFTLPICLQYSITVLSRLYNGVEKITHHFKKKCFKRKYTDFKKVKSE
jgi:hypothetical protein